MSEDPKRYEIVTVADMAAVPRDRWDAFLVDLTIAVNAMRATNETFSLGPEDMLDGAMIWTDDGAPGVTLNVLGEDGEPGLTIQAGADA